jgi:hypothetical protein
MPYLVKHWEYFLTVEAELTNCARYVAFTEDNYLCYSNEFAKVILLAASEVDSIFQEMCTHLGTKADKIHKYRPVLVERFPKLISCRLSIERYRLDMQPWKGWSESKNPDWWSASYNKLKHDRFKYFKNATLISALNAVAAQFLAVQLYHLAFHGETITVDIAQNSALFRNKRHPADRGGARWTYGDPFSYVDDEPVDGQ